MVNSNNCIVPRLYEAMLVDVARGKSNWASYIKNLLDIAGFSDIWISPNNTHLKYVHIIFKQILIDQFKPTWYNRLCLYYICLKSLKMYLNFPCV